MTTPAFPASPVPSYSPSARISNRVRQADFGDGYSQRAPDGLNTRQEEVSLSWDARTDAEIDTLEDFLDARGGYQAFTYTLPWEATAKKWVCQEWTRTRTGFAPGRSDLSATFRRVFDL